MKTLKFLNIVWCIFFLPSTRSLKDSYRLCLESLGFWTDCVCQYQSVEQNTQPATPQIDTYVQINRNELPSIQMHFVLLTTISLLFVWEGTFELFWERAGACAPKVFSFPASFEPFPAGTVWFWFPYFHTQDNWGTQTQVLQRFKHSLMLQKETRCIKSHEDVHMFLIL